MTIKINQSLCGEHNKAWDLLKTTLEEQSLAKKIAFQADLQDSPPSGLKWLPAIRGFLFGEHYLIIKTYPDNSVNVRKGRVFSHCLIIEKKDIQSITDLSPIFSIFKDEIDKSIPLEVLHLKPTSVETEYFETLLDLRFNKIIKSFSNFISEPEPIIWVGQKDFELAVCKLWKLLPPKQRESFSFGINFNASEVEKNKLSFIAIPENAENKFQNKNFTTIKKEDSAELTEFSEQFLAGHKEAKDKIEKFISAVESSHPALSEIATIAKGIPTFENIEKEADLKRLNTLSNIIAKFSSDEDKGKVFKKRLVERISLLLENAEESDIFLIRNFKLHSFKDSEVRITASIQKWLNNYLFNELNNQKINFVPFIIRIQEAPKDNWLVKLVLQAISDFLHNINLITAKIIWQWITYDGKIIDFIFDNVNNLKATESYFCNSFKAIDGDRLQMVREISISKNWFRLHAIIVKYQYSFEEALKEQLKIDYQNSNLEGIEIILDGIKPKEIIDFSVKNNDNRLIQISGKLCKTNSKLLENIQVENLQWQRVWLESIQIGNKVFEGIKEPKRILYSLFDQLVLGKAINEELLQKISATDLANILDYPKRNILWSKLPLTTKNIFLEKTSSVILETLSKNSTYQVPIDKELSKYILSNGIGLFLYYNRNNIKNVLPIFNNYTQIPEHIIRDYINNYSGKMDVVDATQLGQIVNTRHYTTIAEIIWDRSLSNKAYKHALKECYRLLAIVKRTLSIGLLGLTDVSVSKDEWWESFVKLAYNLYEEGPTQNKIWTQADGKGFDLNKQGSGKEVWIIALEKLRKGESSGKITVKKLLKAMHEEHKRNEELKILKKLWDKI